MNNIGAVKKIRQEVVSSASEEALNKENSLWRLKLIQIIFEGNPLKDTR